MKKYSKNIETGKVLSFDRYDEGSYEILVNSIEDTKIRGLVLYFDSCYPEATYPPSIIPTIDIEEFDMDDGFFVENSIEVRDATNTDLAYEENALTAQREFLKKMVPVDDKSTYQELVFSIQKVEESFSNKNGVFSKMEFFNIIDGDVDKTAKYPNPYVVNRIINANSLELMEKAYQHYGSVKGVVIPETMIRFNVSHIRKDDKNVKEICGISLPYSIVRNKGMGIFPLLLDEDIKEKIYIALEFLSLHEDKARKQEQTSRQDKNE